MVQSMGHTMCNQIFHCWPVWFCKQCEVEIEQDPHFHIYKPSNSNQHFNLWEMGDAISHKHSRSKLHELELSMSPEPTITTLKSMESTFITHFIIFIS